jgi:homoserine dehydrogenase
MKRYRLCFLGFGNVGRALARLFVSKTAELRDNYGIEWEITGVATRRMGWRASDNAIDVATLLAGNDETPAEPGLNEWLALAKPDVVFETTSLNPETGQPAIQYLNCEQGPDRLCVLRTQRTRPRKGQAIYV